MTTATDSDFLTALRQNPSDLILRLLYADWLEERGRPSRAECLRSEVTAAEVLGTASAHSVLDVERHFGHSYSERELQALASLPFSIDTLVECKDTHVLFPTAPLSLLDIRDKHPELFYSRSGCWYVGVAQQFSRMPVPLRWHLLRTTPVPGSLHKSWNQQLALLEPEDEVPSAAAVAFATVLHYRVAGQRLFENADVRTSDQAAERACVYVGDFDSHGFRVFSDWDERNDFLELASARRVST